MQANERISLDLIKEVGQDVAAMYGASLKTYKIQALKQKVIYVMNEHGEIFQSEMTFDEIKKW